MTGLQLRARAAVRTGGGRWLVPPWIAPAFGLCVIVLVPWTGYLFGALPPDYTANNWAVAWGGFDIGLVLALGSTALLLARRSPFAEVMATVSGTLLLCDAWFDVLTARGTWDVVESVVEALVVELPLAVLCFWIARNLAQAFEVARPYLAEAGFTVRGNKLVPPPEKAPRPATSVGTDR
jgi:hypothetical protein